MAILTNKRINAFQRQNRDSILTIDARVACHFKVPYWLLVRFVDDSNCFKSNKNQIIYHSSMHSATVWEICIVCGIFG